MFTCFGFSKEVAASELFGGRLEHCGIREHVSPETHERKRCLTDGRNYLWVNINEDGLVSTVRRHGMNAPSKILTAIAETFDTDIFSEREPQYWGFNTQEELDAFWHQMAERDRKEFYAKVCAYVRGEPNIISPGTIGETKAQIAKTLAAKDPTLLLVENKEKLLSEMEAIFERDHCVTVVMSPEDLAAAQMIATHEDDLPQA
jgi:hypothetical protein